VADLLGRFDEMMGQRQDRAVVLDPQRTADVPRTP